MTTRYHAYPHTGAGSVKVRRITETSIAPLDPRNDLRNHSPDGFQMGYGGSGPAQLALALCADAMSDEEALIAYQKFKWEFVRWQDPAVGFTITDAEIRDICFRPNPRHCDGAA